MKDVIILTGPTASGKSRFAVNFAIKNKNIDIINADSMQVYLEIPITSAQPDKEDLINANHKKYGFLNGNIQLTVGKWIEIIVQEIKTSHENERIPMLVGGSAMYIRLLIDGMANIPNITKETSQEVYEIYKILGKDGFYQKLITQDQKSIKIKPNDTQRTFRAFEVFHQTGKSIFELQANKAQSELSNYNLHKILLMPTRDEIYKSCNQRFLDMIKNGALEEIEKLIKLQYSRQLSIHKAIGVPEIISYLENEINKEKMIEKAQQHTRNYSKRQSTWFVNKFQDFDLFIKAHDIQVIL